MGAHIGSMYMLGVTNFNWLQAEFSKSQKILLIISLDYVVQEHTFSI